MDFCGLPKACMVLAESASAARTCCFLWRTMAWAVLWAGEASWLSMLWNRLSAYSASR